MQDATNRDERVHHHYHCCGIPAGRPSAIFWGITLLIVGVCWLLTEAGFLARDWWAFLGPALLLVWGGGLVAWALRGSLARSGGDPARRR